MRHSLRFSAAAMLAAFVLPAIAGTPCEDVKEMIEQKIKAHDVEKYTLEVVTVAQAEAAADRKVVGVCEGGTKRIVYKRG